MQALFITFCFKIVFLMSIIFSQSVVFGISVNTAGIEAATRAHRARVLDRRATAEERRILQQARERVFSTTPDEISIPIVDWFKPWSGPPGSPGRERREAARSLREARNLYEDMKEVGYTHLHVARTAEEVRKFIAQGGDVNAKDRRGRSPLHYAYNPEVANALVEAGANVNARDSKGQSALHLSYDESVARALIDAGAKVDARDDRAMTPLVWQRNFPGMVKVLVEAGADVNARREGYWDDTGRAIDAETILHGIENPDSARLLIEAGADVNAVDYNGYTPLHTADSIDVARVFVEGGADIRRKRLMKFDRGHLMNRANWSVGSTPINSGYINKETERFLREALGDQQNESAENCHYTYVSGPDQTMIISCGAKKICVAKVSCKLKLDGGPIVTRTYQAHCPVDSNGECPSAETCASSISEVRRGGSVTRPVRTQQSRGIR